MEFQKQVINREVVDEQFQGFGRFLNAFLSKLN